jgi:hypothetical protein
MARLLLSKLSDVREGEGVGARDAFAGKLHSDIAKENVNVEDRGEVVDAVRKVSGDDVVAGLRAFGARAGVVGAEGRVAFGAKACGSGGQHE